MEKKAKDMMDISKRIIKIREKFNMSKVKMADELQISKQTYYTLELGTRKLQIEELKILMNKFNIHPIWVLSGEEEMLIENNKKQVALTNMITDFRSYGGEIEIVKNEIVKKILEKLFPIKKIFRIIPIPHSLHGDHILYALMQILINSNFLDNEKNAKNYFRDQIESFNKAGGPMPKEVKKTLYAMQEKIDCKDCFYLLKYKEIAAKQLLAKISPIDRTFNHIFIKKDRKLHQLIEKQYTCYIQYNLS